MKRNVNRLGFLLVQAKNSLSLRKKHHTLFSFIVIVGVKRARSAICFVFSSWGWEMWFRRLTGRLVRFFTAKPSFVFFVVGVTL